MTTSPAGDTGQIPHLTLMDELEAEAQRQDRKHGRFTGATALGRSRLAIACLEDEIAEVKEAWREERRTDGWAHTEEELLQVAAVAMRALRDLREDPR